jgi:uncharacterized protein YbbC (DUF1343 family)
MRCSFILLLLLLVQAASGVATAAPVQLGSETLAAGNFRELQGKRVGLVTNPSGVNRRGQSTIDLLRSAAGVNLVALFAPEHGVDGLTAAGDSVAKVTHRPSGLPVHSLYGATRKPTPAMLKGLDVLVYDLQDTGCRSYTFISTLGLAMEACAESGVEFIVLDRPNPLGGLRIEGPMLDPDFRSFVGQWDIPYIYGLTCGELARMINGQRWIAKPCKLTVIPMSGWQRSMTWQDTGLHWTVTSPNVPRVTSAFGYSAVGVFGEIAGVSGITIGIGFGRPFECIAAPWLNAEALSKALNAYNLPGLNFVPFRTRFREQSYQGVELLFTDPRVAPLYSVNFHLLDAIRQISGRNLFAETVQSGRNFTMFDKVNGTDTIRAALAAGRKTSDIIRAWQADEKKFRTTRRPYLLYPEPSGAAALPQLPPADRPSQNTSAATPTSLPGAVGNASPPAASSPSDHYLITIRRGDTLSKIGKDLGVSVSEIVEANPGMDANRIRIGQQLRVPRRR